MFIIVEFKLVVLVGVPITVEHLLWAYLYRMSPSIYLPHLLRIDWKCDIDFEYRVSSTQMVRFILQIGMYGSLPLDFGSIDVQHIHRVHAQMSGLIWWCEVQITEQFFHKFEIKLLAEHNKLIFTLMQTIICMGQGWQGVSDTIFHTSHFSNRCDA